MPEPNLPPLRVNLKTKDDSRDVISVLNLQENLPELPEQSRQNLINSFDLKPETAIQLVNEPILLDLFNELVKIETRNPLKVGNLLTNELLTSLNNHKLNISDCSISVTQLGEIIDLYSDKIINLDTCRKIFDELLNSNVEIPISTLVNEKSWSLVTNEDEITKKCLEVIENNPKMVQQYRSGKVKIFKALVGALSKNNHEKLDMATGSKILEDLLKNHKNK